MTKSEWKAAWREWRLTLHLLGRGLPEEFTRHAKFDIRIIFAAHDAMKCKISAITQQYESRLTK